MVVANDTKFPWNNVGSTNFENTSVLSIGAATSKAVTAITTATTTPTSASEENSNSAEKRLGSMTDEEIIQKNLRDLMDKKHQEERKANGRLVAVILASLVIFLAIYHAWIRNSGMLAGVLIPAVIMFSFGAWVMVLARRDKAKREVFEKYLQEVAQKNKQELEAKKFKKSKDKKSSSNILLHYENEINSEQMSLGQLSGSGKETKPTSITKNKDHRKHRKYRKQINSDSHSTTSSSSSSKNASHHVTKDLRVKRPSIRQKLFQRTGIYHMTAKTPNATQTLVEAIINTPVTQGTPQLVNGQCPNAAKLLETKRRRLQRLEALQVPSMVRMSSAP